MTDLPRSEADRDVAERFRAAGIVVPADRAAGTYAAGRRLLAHLHWLRRPRGPAAEPAPVFQAGSSSDGR